MTEISKLVNGKGLFTDYDDGGGELLFDEYWCHYETKDMAKKDSRDEPHYKNVEVLILWQDSSSYVYEIA